MDCEFLRPQQPWETTDGCIYLLRELAEGWPAEVCALVTLSPSFALKSTRAFALRLPTHLPGRPAKVRTTIARLPQKSPPPF
jgi:hypothetical protein